MRVPVIFFAFFLFFSACRSPTGLAASFSEAEGFYRKGEWEKAASAFKELLAENKDTDTAALYNYGAALYRSGKIGAAYVVLTKAKLGTLFDGDLNHNYEVVKTKLAPETLWIRPASWFAWIPEPLRFFPTVLWLFLALACAVAITLRMQFRSPSAQEKASVPAIGVLFLVFYLLLLLEQRFPLAGIQEDSVIRSGPEATFPEITKAASGALVDLEEEKAGWGKVRFQLSGQAEVVGWIELEKLLVLRR